MVIPKIPINAHPKVAIKASSDRICITYYYHSFMNKQCMSHLSHVIIKVYHIFLK